MQLSDDGSILEEVIEADLDANGQVDIPESVTQIGEETFAGFTALTALHLAEGVQIGESAFQDCTGLRELYLSEGVQIDEYAFMGCTGLMALHLSEGVLFGGFAFGGCTNLTALHLPEGVQIDEYAFMGCTGLRELHLAAGVQIGEGAFDACRGLTELHLAAGVHIGEGAFEACPNLEYIFIDGDEAEMRRITAMLPESLRANVIPKAIYDSAHAHIEQELKKLQLTPETNPLYFWATNRSRNEQPRLNLKDDSLTNVNEFLSEENHYYAKARGEIPAFQLPKNEEELEGYKIAVTSVVAHYIEMARAGIPVESDVSVEDLATEEGYGPT